MGDIQLD
jgi:hypothetical protein